MLYEILLLKAFRPNFAKMRQRSSLRNFITFLAKKQGQQVEEFMIKTLANLDEQLWNENGFLRELGKPKQILHIGILLDGLLIAQPLWHASLSEHQQPCGRAYCLHRCVGSSVACCIPALSCPREDCQQASPSGWTCSNPRETLEAQTARDCGIGRLVGLNFCQCPQVRIIMIQAVKRFDYIRIWQVQFVDKNIISLTVGYQSNIIIITS